ncbi:hypothetical protein K402DRAFT_155599 [Aulographum hederae CBS 113979]|uniref:Uncharacterized protein n=1 Tax=Aulographum hederae CBS 113979 TaxID=1176131 RepID=A0A6G1GSP5_9PEZI|nr:hypothetical protein K402DRAFT_155599 [Aulographum hederae CBS 113979]
MGSAVGRGVGQVVHGYPRISDLTSHRLCPTLASHQRQTLDSGNPHRSSSSMVHGDYQACRTVICFCFSLCFHIVLPLMLPFLYHGNRVVSVRVGSRPATGEVSISGTLNCKEGERRKREGMMGLQMGCVRLDGGEGERSGLSDTPSTFLRSALRRPANGDHGLHEPPPRLAKNTVSWEGLLVNVSSC